MGKAHCWMSESEHVHETFGENSPEAFALQAEDYMSKTCMEWDGHDGPHRFVRDDQIAITFPPLTGGSE